MSERPNNPSASPLPLLTATFPASMVACDALYACAEFGFSDNNLNFDLHFLITQNEWFCAVYPGQRSTSADWNIADANIGAPMGYQFVKVAH
jgi:hypothetical protein